LTGVLICRRASRSLEEAGVGSGIGVVHDSDVEDMGAQFVHLGTKSTRPDSASRSASANLCSPSRFRLVGLFRSHSRTWTPTVADEATLSLSSSPKPQALLLKKKQKMRILV
jgi:hypothetical protein